MFQPATGIFHFETAMRLVRFRAQTNLFDLDLGLCPFGFFFLLGSFVDELAKIHHTTDGWVGSRRDLNQVKVGVTGDLQGLLDGDNTDITAIRPD